MSLSFDPESKDYGNVNSPPNITVKIKESDNLEIRGTATIRDGENNTVATETFTEKGKYDYTPNLSSKWEQMSDGDCNIQLSVTSYEENPEDPVYADKNSLYLVQDTFTYDGHTKTPVLHGYDPNKMVLFGDTSAISVGEYRLRVRILEGYYWAFTPNNEDKYADLVYTWRINKGKGYIIINGVTVYDGGVYNVTLNSMNTVTYSVSNPLNPSATLVAASTPNYNIAYISRTYDNNLYIEPRSNGNTSIRMCSLGNNNISDIYVTINVTVNAIKTISSLPTWSNSPLYYDGGIKYPSFYYDSNELTITGGSSYAWYPGTYYTEFTPNSGYQWWDGTTGSKEVYWGINEAYSPPEEVIIPIDIDPTPQPSSDFYFTLSSEYVTVNRGTRTTITLYPHNETGVGRTIYCWNGDSSIATAYEYNWTTQRCVYTEGNNSPITVYVSGEGRGTTTIPFVYDGYPSSTVNLTVTVV